jgi:hypothetical protein
MKTNKFRNAMRIVLNIIHIMDSVHQNMGKMLFTSELSCVLHYVVLFYLSTHFIIY